MYILELKSRNMKRVAIIVILLAFVAAVTYASFSRTGNKQQPVKEKKEKKKECSSHHTCPFA